MPTPVFVCGAECGIAVVGTASAGTEHWNSVQGTPSVSTTTFNSAGGGIRSFRFNPTAAAGLMTTFFATAIASPATLVARFYIYFASLPTATTMIFQSGNIIGGVAFISSDSTLRACGSSSANVAASGAVVTTGQWYRVDVKNVRDATITTDIQVNGVAQTQYSVAGAAGSLTGCGFGQIATYTADFFVDDICVSGTSGDYPIGAGGVAGLYPSADGTHGGGWAAGTFGKGASGATNANNTDTTLWQDLDNPLTTTAAGNWLSDLTGVALTNYVELRNATLSGAASVNGAMLVVTTHSATTTANNFNWDINDGAGHTATLMSVLALNVATITVPVVVRNTDANGVAWTPTTISANRNRFSSTDSNPDVFLDGFCWEVDYVPTSGAASFTVMKGRVAWNPSG